MLAIDAGRRPQWSWPSRAAPSRSRRSAPVARRRGEAGIVQRRAGRPRGCKRGRGRGAPARAMTARLARRSRRWLAGEPGRPHEPGRRRDRRRPRHRCRHRRPTGGRGLAGRRRRRLRRRSRLSTIRWPRRPICEALGPATATRCARWSATCGASPTCGPRSAAAAAVRRSRRRRRRGRRGERRASRCGRLSDAQWNVQFDVNVDGVRHLATAAVPVLLEAPAPRQGRVVAVASAAGLLGLRRLSGYSAVQARGHRPDQGPGRRPGRHRHHRQRRLPGIDPHPVLDASAAVYGLASAEDFAHQQLVERLLEPDEPAALIAWLCARRRAV